MVDELKQLKLDPGNHIVSFDIVSLFTNKPLKESIDLAVDLLLTNDASIKMSRAQLTKLFHFATSQTHFSYNNQYYDQVDGVAMGSPLGPVLANLFMGKFESEWLQEQLGSDGSPLYYRRYVDDIFCVLKSRDQLQTCLESLNRKHPNIKFKVEEENNGSISFLDILVSRTTDSTVDTTTYCKPTNTGLLTNYTSFTDYNYKTGLIKTLADRATKINSTVQLLKQDLQRVSKTLQRNLFPNNIINRILHTTHSDNRTPTDTTETEAETRTLAKETRYYKLPYIGCYSRLVRGKINSLVKDYCTGKINVKLIFSTFKVGQYFSLKDKIPSDLSAFVVYKFSCSSCNACYIGETARHMRTRVDEHLHSDTNSHVYKHLQENPTCKLKCDSSCFSVVDHASSKYQLRIKEALAIKEHNPDLNKQVISYKTKLML